MTNTPLLLRNGRLFDGHSFIEATDLRVSDDGKIAEIGIDLESQAGERLIELNERLLMPGLVDCHVHFREPGLVRKEGYLTGSAGALHGGVTTVMEIQNNPPMMESAALLKSKIENLRGVSHVDYAPYGSLTDNSAPIISELKGLVPAVKCFLGGSTGSGGLKSLKQMHDLFAAAAKAGLKVVAHCEDDELMRQAVATASSEEAVRHDLMRPVAAEVKSIRDAIQVAKETGVELHVFHISTGEGAQLVTAAAEDGWPITSTTGPHYLLIDAEEAFATAQNRFKVNPSIKYPSDRATLLELLEAKKIQGIGTDHAPHPLQDKARPYAKAPSGFPSIDLLLPLVFSIHDAQGLSLERALAAVTADPAEEFKLSNKGRLHLGADADLVICDPHSEQIVDESQLPSKSKWSPYQGRKLRGFPQQVFLRGNEVFADGQVLGEPIGGPIFE